MSCKPPKKFNVGEDDSSSCKISCVLFVSFLLILKTSFSCLNNRGNFKPKLSRNFSKCNVFFFVLEVA